MFSFLKPKKSKTNKTKKTKISYFASVPNEIKVLIFSLLDCKDLSNSSQVCKEWNLLINMNMYVLFFFLFF